MRPDDYSSQPVKHKAFAKRMSDTCDDSPFIPPLNKGRLVWLKEHLEKDFGVDVTRETIRKWISGETIPRNEKLKALATLLKVDEGWLAFGIAKDEGMERAAVRTISENPAATIVAGFIQLAGGMCALPDDDDPKRDFVDLYCIVRARQRMVSCALAEQTGQESFRAYVTNQYRQCLVVLVLPAGDMKVEMFLVPPELIEKNGVTRGPNVEIQATLVDRHWKIGNVVLPRIRDLRRDLA